MPPRLDSPLGEEEKSKVGVHIGTDVDKEGHSLNIGRRVEMQESSQLTRLTEKWLLCNSEF